MIFWRTCVFAVCNGIFWALLIEQPKAAFVSVITLIMWLVTFDDS